VLGGLFAVNGYEEKMLTLGRYKRTDDKAIPHVILPTQGMQDCILTDLLDDEKTTVEVRHHQMISWSLDDLKRTPLCLVADLSGRLFLRSD
jgi:hypothetical protein